ncbi:MAG TPA: ABC transporter substrate-binding protein [Candidatus Marinimicrobia bacterium]|nr:ABC transporter substrate-binding protein [Candidatus Neomarinimicrobiota bacterium]
MKNRKIKRLSIVGFVFLIVMANNCSKPKPRDANSITLTFWHSFVATTLPILDAMIADFEKENPGVKIQAQYVPTGDALIQKIITAIQSRTAPDIAWIHSDFLDNLVNSRAIFSINELAGDDSLFYNQCLPDIFPQLLPPITFRDTLFALPMEATTLALLYNRDWFRQIGLNPDHPPATWAELDSFTMQLCSDSNSDGQPERYGFYVPVFPASGPLNIWMTMQWAPFVWQAGGEIFSNNQPTFASEAGVAALAFWSKLYHQQKFERFSMAHDMGFISQTVAMIMDGPWNLPRYRDYVKFDWGVAPLPAGSAGRASYLAGESLVVFKQCVNPEAAWRFINWFLKPEVQRTFAEKSGYLPVRRSVLNDSDYVNFLEQFPQQKSFNEQIRYARGRSLPDKFRVEVNQCIAEALESSIIGRIAPEKSLKVADEKIRRLLSSETE